MGSHPITPRRQLWLALEPLQSSSCLNTPDRQPEPEPAPIKSGSCPIAPSGRLRRGQVLLQGNLCPAGPALPTGAPTAVIAMLHSQPYQGQLLPPAYLQKPHHTTTGRHPQTTQSATVECLVLWLNWIALPTEDLLNEASPSRPGDTVDLPNIQKKCQ